MTHYHGVIHHGVLSDSRSSFLPCLLVSYDCLIWWTWQREIEEDSIRGHVTGWRDRPSGNRSVPTALSDVFNWEALKLGTHISRMLIQIRSENKVNPFFTLSRRPVAVYFNLSRNPPGWLVLTFSFSSQSTRPLLSLKQKQYVQRTTSAILTRQRTAKRSHTVRFDQY